MKQPVRSWDAFPINPVVSALALAFGGGMAHAAEEPQALPEIAVEADAENSYAVERSANQKFTAPLIDTPKSVTVITADVIKDTGATTFQEALRTAPGITFGTGEGGGTAFSDRPFIRGFD